MLLSMRLGTFIILLCFQSLGGHCLFIEQRDYGAYINRIYKMGKNKITLNPPYCMYCKGYGYMKCLDCDDGCWRCSQSTLIPCKFCFGDGKGRYAYREINK